MFQQLAAVSTITIDAPKEAVLPIVWDIKGIEKFEVKADAINVFPINSKDGTYKVTGHFAGLPWRREFAYFRSPDGFYSRDAHPSGPNVTVQGGFIVQATGAYESTIIHYEMYYLSAWFVPFKPFIAAYLKWSMRKELNDMKEAVLQSYRPSQKKAS